MTHQLIVTADDFGMSLEVNDAVEEAHRKGVLTCASLVITGDAAGDAVSRARRLPDLGVGLHLALVSAPPALHPSEIPDLLDGTGRWLGEKVGATGTRIATLAKVSAQARAETRAQLERFKRTGLRLDHVDGHWHFHQHPTVVKALVSFASEFAIRAVRVPYEPALASWRAAGREGLIRRAAKAAMHLPLAQIMRRTLTRAGILSNDWFFGMNDGGVIARERLLGFIAHLPPGVTEIGLHPARRSWIGPHAPPANWRVQDELAALIDADVIAACRKPGLRLARFADLASAGAGQW